MKRQTVHHYTAEEIEALIVPSGVNGKGHGKKIPLEKVDAVEPRENQKAMGMIARMRENDPRFDETWLGTRKDLEDSSPSGYDMSLCRQMAMIGCTDQEMADAIYLRRSERNENPKKALRRDYLMLTIANARSKTRVEEAAEEIKESAAKSDTSIPDERVKDFRNISQVLGVSIVKVIKHGRESAIYSLVLADGTDIAVGDAVKMLNFRAVKAAIYDVTSVVLRKMPGEEWDALIELLGRHAEMVENIESSRVVQITEWLRRYVHDYQQMVFSGEEKAQALVNCEPFVQNGNLFVNSDSLLRFINTHSGDRVTRKRLWDSLRLAGYKGGQHVSVRVEGRVIGRKYWVGSADTVIEDEAEK